MNEKLRRASRHQLARYPRSLALFVVVVAMIVGLLAMHVFASDLGNHNAPGMGSMPATAVMSGNMSPAAADIAPAATVPVPHPNLIMTSMICILALLLTGLLLAVARPMLLRFLFDFASNNRRLLCAAGVRAGPAPPSLIGLSIFRI